jgi:phage-related holin
MMVITEKPFRSVMGTALKRLILKLISFKNFMGLLAIAMSMVVVAMPHIQATFKDWGDFVFKVLVLFYASNQVQKWIFARFGVKDSRPDDLYDVTEEPCDNEYIEYGEDDE